MSETDKILIDYGVTLDGFKIQMHEVEKRLKAAEAIGKQTAANSAKAWNSAGASIKRGVTEIAAQIGVAYGVSQVIAFGKESIKAFTEAEANANKLRFAVEKIGGEGSSAFNKLIKQSEELQKTTIFSDDSIQQAQTALATFGLTSDQIESLIPQLTDLASATGTDLVSATEKAIQGINGQTRGLKTVGIQFADTGSKTENLAILTDKLTKFQGASSEALETTAGKAKRLENAFDDIKEKIGEYLVGAGADILDNFEAIGNFANVFASKESEKLTSAMDKVNEKTLANAQKSEDARLQAIETTNKNILVLEQNLANAKNGAEKKIRTDLLNNQKKLLSDLNVLNQKQVIEDDKTLGGLKVEKAEDLDKKLRDLKIAGMESEYEKKKATIIAQYADEEEKEAGHSEILLQLAKNREKELRDLYVAREKDYEKIRTEAKDKSVDIFKEGVSEIAAEDTKLANHVIANQDKIIEKVELSEKQRVALQEASVNTIKSMIDSLQEISNNFTEQAILDNRTRADSEIASEQARYDQGLISKEEFEASVAEINKKASEEERELKKQQFESNKNAAVISALISTFQGVAGALAQTAELGYAAYILAGLIAASGAAQVAAIESQPTPKFEKGGKIKGKRHSAGGTLIEAEVDEYVVNRNDALKNDPLLNAINKGKGDSFIYDYYVAPALRAQQKKQSESRDKSFASNLAGSMGFNFKDGNLLESLKQSRRNDKEIALFLAKKIEGSHYNNRKW